MCPQKSNNEKMTSPRMIVFLYELTINIWLTCSIFCSCLNNIPLYIYLEAVHKCQHIHECSNHMLSGGGVCENQHFFRTLLTFWPAFYHFHEDYWHSKNVEVYSFFWGGGGLRMCMVCTLMNMLTFMDSPLHLWTIKRLF